MKHTDSGFTDIKEAYHATEIDGTFRLRVRTDDEGLRRRTAEHLFPKKPLQRISWGFVEM